MQTTATYFDHHVVSIQCSPLSALVHPTNSYGHRSKAAQLFAIYPKKSIPQRTNGQRPAQLDCSLLLRYNKGIEITSNTRDAENGHQSIRKTEL